MPSLILELRYASHSSCCQLWRSAWQFLVDRRLHLAEHEEGEYCGSQVEDDGKSEDALRSSIRQGNLAANGVRTVGTTVRMSPRQSTPRRQPAVWPWRFD